MCNSLEISSYLVGDMCIIMHIFNTSIFVCLVCFAFVNLCELICFLKPLLPAPLIISAFGLVFL